MSQENETERQMSSGLNANALPVKTDWSRPATLLFQLITLGVGVTLGFLLGQRRVESTVEAAQTAPQAPPVDAGSIRPTPVQPTLGAPSIGANLILAHQIESDVAVVNGFNLLKIDEGIINYLGSHGFSDGAALSAIIANARERDVHTLTVTAPAPQTKTTAPSTSEKK